MCRSARPPAARAVATGAWKQWRPPPPSPSATPSSAARPRTVRRTWSRGCTPIPWPERSGRTRSRRWPTASPYCPCSPRPRSWSWAAASRVAGPDLIDPLGHAVKQRTRVVVPARVAAAQLGDRGGVVGAALLAFDEWATQMNPTDVPPVTNPRVLGGRLVLEDRVIEDGVVAIDGSRLSYVGPAAGWTGEPAQPVGNHRARLRRHPLPRRRRAHRHHRRRRRRRRCRAAPPSARDDRHAGLTGQRSGRRDRGRGTRDRRGGRVRRVRARQPPGGTIPRPWPSRGARPGPPARARPGRDEAMAGVRARHRADGHPGPRAAGLRGPVGPGGGRRVSGRTGAHRCRRRDLRSRAGRRLGLRRHPSVQRDGTDAPPRARPRRPPVWPRSRPGTPTWS